ncbi:hypothetical protein HDU84_005757 [Entophlyctis sp. JEL0112]|nr:hypothetical protein HDU84_005757 [Entophlyctis sp. JEL0112]
MQGHAVTMFNQGFTLSGPVRISIVHTLSNQLPCLQATYTPGGDPLTFIVSNVQATSFQGVLSFVTVGAIQDSQRTAMGNTGPTMHVGSFLNLSSMGLRAQTSTPCSAQNVTDENDAMKYFQL